MIVVIFIVATISGISVANFRGAEKQKRAVIAVDTVVASLRQAQNSTLTGKNTNNADPSCRVPQFYYVIFGYSSAYSLLAYNNCGTLDLIESYNLPANTRVKANGLVLGSTVATSNLSVVFYPPFATIKAGVDNGGYNTFTTATIQVETTDGSATKTVTIDGVAGRIGE